MDSHQVWKDNRVFEGAGDPDQIQRILIHADLTSKTGGIVAAEERSAIRIHTYAEVSHPYLQLSRADYVCNGRCDTWIDLGRIEDWRI